MWFVCCYYVHSWIIFLSVSIHVLLHIYILHKIVCIFHKSLDISITFLFMLYLQLNCNLLFWNLNRNLGMLCAMQTEKSEDFFCHFGFPLLVGSFWCVMPFPENILQNKNLQIGLLFSILLERSIVIKINYFTVYTLKTHFSGRTFQIGPFLARKTVTRTKIK